MNPLRNPLPPPPPEKGNQRAAKEVTRDKQLMARVTQDVKNKVELAAKAEGKSISDFILAAINEKIGE